MSGLIHAVMGKKLDEIDVFCTSRGGDIDYLLTFMGM